MVARRYHDARRIAFPLLAGITVGLIDEWMQWFVPGRVGELRDIGLNAIAVIAGVGVALAFDRPPRATLSIRGGAARGITALLTVVLVLTVTFVYYAHVGYEIHDTRLGTFRSRYDAATLRLSAADRARRWRGVPPEYASRLSREDHYYSEALWHVRERNDAVQAGDYVTAWHEQLILEEYFSPVLAMPEHRWPLEQRADVGARAQAGERAPYVSAAHPLPIYVFR